MLSDDLLDEIIINLRVKTKIPDNLVENFRIFMRDHSKFTTPVFLPSDVCRDPDDIKILGLTAASNADCIITGDKDLLALKKFRGIPILNPRSFSDIFHRKEK